MTGDDLQDPIEQPLDSHAADPAQKLADGGRVVHQGLQLRVTADPRGVLENLRQLGTPRLQPLRRNARGLRLLPVSKV